MTIRVRVARAGRVGLLVAAGAVVPMYLVAQERMTLDEAIQRALVRSPAMAQQNQAVGNAEASQQQAWGSFLPSLSASSSGSLRSQNRFDPTTDRIVSGSSDSYSAGLSASYTVFAGGRRFADLNQARASTQAAEVRREDQRFQVTLQTKEAFFQALRQADLEAVEESRLAQALRNLEMVRRRTEVGRATVSDSLRARLDYVNAQQAVLRAQTATRAARFALGRQVGLGEPVEPAWDEAFEPAPLGMTDEEVLALAEASSPSVVAAEQAATAADAGVRAARTAYLPSVSFSTGYDWANQAASFSDGTTSWSLALRASFPIFNGFQREATVERARFSQVVATLQEDDARLAARQEADAALQEVRTAELAIGIAREAVAVAQEDLRVVRQRYDLSAATILDVIISQAAADQAAADAVTSRYDYILARAQLEAVLGRELGS
ncbi:MAG: TolC family protein [Longimicrobiales bacterium]